MNDTLDTDTLRLVDSLAQIAEAQASLEAQAVSLKAELRARLRPGATYVDDRGQRRVQLQPNRRFDRNRAAEVLPAELLQLCTISVVDSATARKQLPPAKYAECMVEIGDPKVVLL